MKKIVISMWLITVGLSSLFSHPILNIYAEYLPENPVIVEAGANNGGATQEMSRVWPNSKIYAFEPCPEIYLELVKNMSSRSNVFTFPIALADRDGTARFYISKGGDGGQGSLLPPSDGWIWPYITMEETVDVTVRTLDSWAKENNVSKVDFLWLDLQGMEFQVLQAAPEILSTVKLIQAEFSFIPSWCDGVVLYPQLKAFLLEKGFIELFKDENVLGGDAVFVRL